MNASGSYRHSKVALLLSDSDDCSTSRGDHIRQVLSSSGFDVRTFSNVKDGLMDLPKASEATDATVVVFDLTGRGGHSLSQASEEAQVEGLYVFKSATGMFRKVRPDFRCCDSKYASSQKNVMLCWSDPHDNLLRTATVQKLKP